MTIMLASKTLAAIDHAIEADGGGSFREWLGKVIPHIGDAYRKADDGFRAHLGASVMGNECGRAIWYGFRWATKAKFSARILRLFNRGHLEEARFIALLLMIGVKVYQQDEQGKQFRIHHAGGHVGGSGDGIGFDIPDIPAGQAALLEFKTHGEKSFLELKSKGMRAAKFEHYVQMQMYMRKMGMAYGLYMAVNKNTDEIYAEIIVIDTAIGDQFLVRATTIVFMREAPKRISESPGWFACKWCDHRPVCHLRATPEKNCRTCAFSKAEEDGTWVCTNLARQQELIAQEAGTFTIPKETQLVGCTNYMKHSSF